MRSLEFDVKCVGCAEVRTASIYHRSCGPKYGVSCCATQRAHAALTPDTWSSNR